MTFEEAQAIATTLDKARREKIAALARVRFVCGHDWLISAHSYRIGVMWGRNLDALEGEWVYRHRLVLCVTFSMRLERW